MSAPVLPSRRRLALLVAATMVPACVAPAAPAVDPPAPRPLEQPRTPASAAPSTPPTAAPDAEPAPDPLDVEMGRLAAMLQAPLVSSDGKLVATTGEQSEFYDEGAPAIRYSLVRILDVDNDRQIKAVRFDWHYRTPARYEGKTPVDEAGKPWVNYSPEDRERGLARVAEARALLGERTWEAAIALDTAPDASAAPRIHGLGESIPLMASGAGLTVQFHEPTLVVKGDSGRSLLRRAFPRWSEKGPVIGHACSRYADLGTAWADRARGVLVLDIYYSASPAFCDLRPARHVVRFVRKR